MRDELRHLQVTVLLANLIISTSGPQFPLTQIIPAGNNAWLVFFLNFPFTVFLIMVGLAGINKLSVWNIFSVERTTYHPAEKGLACLFILFITLLLLKDVQSIIMSIQFALLPMTSTFVTTTILMLLVAYVAQHGIGTVANFHEIIFFPTVLLAMVVITGFIWPKMDLLNVIPILNGLTYPSILQAAFNALPFAGEIVVLFFILGQIRPLRRLRFAAIAGAAIGTSVVYLYIFIEIAIFNSELLSNQIFPAISLIREVQITEAMDRIDLLLFFNWMPMVFAKLSLEMYILYRSIRILTGIRSTKMIYPMAISCGLLGTIFFSNHMDHYLFFLKNNNFGGILILASELLIVIAFVVIVRLMRKYFD